MSKIFTPLLLLILECLITVSPSFWVLPQIVPGVSVKLNLRSFSKKSLTPKTKHTGACHGAALRTSCVCADVRQTASRHQQQQQHAPCSHEDAGQVEVAREGAAGDPQPCLCDGGERMPAPCLSVENTSPGKRLRPTSGHVVLR